MWSQTSSLNQCCDIVPSLVVLHPEKLQSFSKDLPQKALDLYPPSDPCPTRDRCPERAYTTMASDIRVTCPNNDLAWRAAGRSFLFTDWFRFEWNCDVTDPPHKANCCTVCLWNLNRTCHKCFIKTPGKSHVSFNHMRPLKIKHL